MKLGTTESFKAWSQTQEGKNYIANVNIQQSSHRGETSASAVAKIVYPGNLSLHDAKLIKEANALFAQGEKDSAYYRISQLSNEVMRSAGIVAGENGSLRINIRDTEQGARVTVAALGKTSNPNNAVEVRTTSNSGEVTDIEDKRTYDEAKARATTISAGGGFLDRIRGKIEFVTNLVQASQEEKKIAQRKKEEDAKTTWGLLTRSAARFDVGDLNLNPVVSKKSKLDLVIEAANEAKFQSQFITGTYSDGRTQGTVTVFVQPEHIYPEIPEPRNIEQIIADQREAALSDPTGGIQHFVGGRRVK